MRTHRERHPSQDGRRGARLETDHVSFGAVEDGEHARRRRRVEERSVGTPRERHGSEGQGDDLVRGEPRRRSSASWSPLTCCFVVHDAGR
jgi:hypothetical protein